MNNTNTVPLEEALPWSSQIPRNVLICDTLESDGRFLLANMATQILSKKNSGGSGNVLWLSFGPTTQRQVATALKKMGCDVAAAYLRNTSNTTGGNLTIKSLSTEIGDTILTSLSEGSSPSTLFDGEKWIKGLYQEIKLWIQSKPPTSDEIHQSPCWIFLDDLSALNTMLGERLVFKFVDSLLSFSRHSANKFGIAIRCCNDVDYILSKRADDDGKSHDKEGWLGAGGSAHKVALKQNQNDLIPWERCLELKVDAIVDVLPLTSGYSREAQGRLIFSECPTGRGWGTNHKLKPKTQSSAVATGSRVNEFLINYCLNDNGVRAIRLRSKN